MNKVIVVCVRIMCFLMFGAMIAILYFSGYFRDEMTPIIHISWVMTYGMWLLLAVSAVLLFWSFPALRESSSRKVKVAFWVVFLAAIIGFAAMVAVGAPMVKDYHPGLQNTTDVDGQWLEKQMLKEFPEDDKVKSAEWIATYYTKEARYHLVGGKCMEDGKQKLKVYLGKLSAQEGKDVKFQRLTLFSVLDMDDTENAFSAQHKDKEVGLTLYFSCGIRTSDQKVYFNGALLDLEDDLIYGVIRPSPFEIEVKK